MARVSVITRERIETPDRGQTIYLRYVVYFPTYVDSYSAINILGRRARASCLQRRDKSDSARNVSKNAPNTRSGVVAFTYALVTAFYARSRILYTDAYVRLHT